MKKNIKKEKGYAVLELLFYIAFLSVLSLVVINAMITMAGSFRETGIQAQLVQSGTIMERMEREIKAAYGISSISANDLILNSKNPDGTNKTIEFKLLNSNIQLLENGALTGNLNTPDIKITSLNFTQTITAKSKAVQISLTLNSTQNKTSGPFDFNDTAVLRGSYQ